MKRRDFPERSAPPWQLALRLHKRLPLQPASRSQDRVSRPPNLSRPPTRRSRPRSIGRNREPATNGRSLDPDVSPGRSRRKEPSNRPDRRHRVTCGHAAPSGRRRLHQLVNICRSCSRKGAAETMMRARSAAELLEQYHRQRHCRPCRLVLDEFRGSRSIYKSKAPIKTIDDVKGLRSIRVQATRFSST